MTDWKIFVRDTLATASALGCILHEEKEPVMNAEPGSRFSIILPDSRLVSTARYTMRPAALLAICQAVRPYLDKIERDDAAGVMPRAKRIDKTDSL